MKQFPRSQKTRDTGVNPDCAQFSQIERANKALISQIFRDLKHAHNIEILRKWRVEGMNAFFI